MSADKRIRRPGHGGGAVDALGAVRQEVEARAMGWVESMLQRMDVPTRSSTPPRPWRRQRAAGEDRP
jgi:hypothetical protein